MARRPSRWQERHLPPSTASTSLTRLCHVLRTSLRCCCPFESVSGAPSVGTRNPASRPPHVQASPATWLWRPSPDFEATRRAVGKPRGSALSPCFQRRPEATRRPSTWRSSHRFADDISRPIRVVTSATWCHAAPSCGWCLPAWLPSLFDPARCRFRGLTQCSSTWRHRRALPLSASFSPRRPLGREKPSRTTAFARSGIVLRARLGYPRCGTLFRENNIPSRPNLIPRTGRTSDVIFVNLPHPLSSRLVALLAALAASIVSP